MNRFLNAASTVLYASLCAFTLSELYLGCAHSQAGKEREAEATYLGEHLRCVDDSDTRAEMDECRRKVRAKWLRDAGIVETTRKDGAR
jgi:hypothetical protein